MSKNDFTFAWDGADAAAGAWAHLQVVKFHGVERMSAPNAYEIVLAAKDGAPRVAPADLIGRAASLRIRTQCPAPGPELKVVHGVIAEAAELDPLPDAAVYRVVVRSVLSRAAHRRRCRIFLGKTLREILEAVLVGDAHMVKDDGVTPEPALATSTFSPAKEVLAVRVADPTRLDDARVRAYTVQYNESDLAFVSRLLEDEGIAYHVEDGEGVTALVLSDTDAGRPRIAPVGVKVTGREITAFRGSARLRPTGVVLGEFNWKKPAAAMDAPAGETTPAARVEYVYPGGFPDAPTQGAPLAKARLDRHAVEASFVRGEGKLRVLSAGSVFAVRGVKDRLMGEHLVTTLEVDGEQQGVLASSSATKLSGVPFSATFTCARRGLADELAESRFRPERATKRPRIGGAQTAMVTADPGTGAEVNVGGPDGISVGCVRLRFHWDKDDARLAKEPSSAWVRVSQPFAGAGEGGIWHPRVGVEAIVEFEEGDPDRPIVTGRVYNGANLPPYGGSAVHSTMKSFSTPGGAVFNELTFDDTSGGELVLMNAGKDMTTEVGNDRTETIAAEAIMTVGSDNAESIGGNHTVSISVNDTCTIGANDVTTVGVSSTTTVGASCTLTVAASDTRTVGTSQTISIGGTHTESVGAAVTETYGGTHTRVVTSDVTLNVGVSRTVTIASTHDQIFGAHAIQVGGDREVTCPSLTTTTNGLQVNIVGGKVESEVGGAVTVNANGGMIWVAPEWSATGPNHEKFDADMITIAGLKIESVGSDLDRTGANFGIKAVGLEANKLFLQAAGFAAETVGLTVNLSGIEVYLKGTKIDADGIAVYL